ncbi:hypothetical protein l13_05960 [Neisseria weaveri ATCC 51223]|nr:hypothetical protein l13_05960 [Neisseria weaveri ATCC 51223]
MESWCNLKLFEYGGRLKKRCFQTASLYLDVGYAVSVSYLFDSDEPVIVKGRLKIQTA